MTAQTKKNVYDLVTDMILEKIEAGTAPWIKPWNAFEAKNMTSMKEYRGINNTILSMLVGESSLFLTFKQAKDLGGTVNKGSKSIPVVFHMFKDEDDPTADRKYIGAKYYRVFRVEDTTLAKDVSSYVDMSDYEPLSEALRNDKIDKALNEMIKGLNLKVTNDRNSAFYQPSSHTLNMPKYKNFKNIDGYYSTFFHELVHATSKELNRDTGGHFGTKDYSFEELVAELGASFLCTKYQVSSDQVDQSAAYIKGWASKFKDDKKMIFKASSLAQQAVDLLMTKLENIPF